MVYDFKSKTERGSARSCNPSHSDREAIQRRQGLHEQIDVAKINGVPQKRDLVVSVGLIDVDIPSLWTTLIARAPAIAALFKFVLEIERGLFSPDPNCFPARVLQQQRQRSSIGAGDGVRQNFQQGMTVINGTV